MQPAASGRSRGWALFAGLLLIGGAFAWWQGHGGPGRGVTTLVLHGGDGGGLPRATPAEEGFDPAALEAALSLARNEGMQAFMVSRHGHLVLAEYGQGIDPQAKIDAGAFAEALAALAAGIAQDEGLLDEAVMADFNPPRLATLISAAAGVSYAEYLSDKVWRAVNAADATIALPAPGAAAPADCCVHARMSDWMRIAGLLLAAGRYEGTQVAPPEWVRALGEPRDALRERGYGLWLASSAHGAEPFASDGVFYLKGPGRWRLWMAPALNVAVLFAADDTSSREWDETLLPNRVFRAIIPRSSGTGGNTLNDIVPGH